MTPPDSILYPLVLSAVISLPLIAGIGLAVKKWQPVSLLAAPWTALPALAAAIWMPADNLSRLSWLLLESHLGIDPTGRIFLLFTAILWIISGSYAKSYLAADKRCAQFFVFFQLSMAGNFGLILSHDAVTFYVFFAMMSFASYGLVVHTGDAKALKAGRAYIILVVIGEVMLFAAFLLLSVSADSLLLKDFQKIQPKNITTLLLLAGFGIKAGALPVHVWLPLAHPAAPTPASAVLSGAMIKAGLLGWLRFLPLGAVAMPEWGALCVAAGLTAAYCAAVVGVTQQNPKTVLAYSSISQMGLITVGVGLSLGWPQLASLALPAVSIYALHHGLAKGVLFLGVGAASASTKHRLAQRLVFSGIVLAALSLAGAPFTSGAVAKISLKLPLESFQANWVSPLAVLLLLAAIGTTFLMARFLYQLIHNTSRHGKLHPGMWVPWTVLVLLSAVLIWFLPGTEKSISNALQGASIWLAFWPVSAGIGISAAVWVWSSRNGWRLPFAIPEGDIICGIPPLNRILNRIGSAAVQRLRANAPATADGFKAPILGRRQIHQSVSRIEGRLVTWQVAGLIFLLVIGLFFLFARIS